MIKVRSIPGLSNFDKGESGIRRVVEAYSRYSRDYGFEYVEDGDYDVYAVHAGMTTRFDFSRPLVSHLHGLYWTADYDAISWEWEANSKVIASIRCAERVTVPSEWVAETLKRDMRFSPTVVHHGIEWEEWQHNHSQEGYVLWNKNRVGDVCNPVWAVRLADQFPKIPFVSTFGPRIGPGNLIITGLQPHAQMKLTVQKAVVYLSTTKETFGIGALEAMASGVPVLGFAHGGNLITVKHGVSGYLARVNDFDDLCQGLEYCLKYRDALGANGREAAKQWSWRNAAKRVGEVYQSALEAYHDRRRPHRIAEESYENHSAEPVR